MKFTEYKNLSIQDTLAKLQTRPSGLTAHEASERLVKYGPNVVVVQKTTWFGVFLRQLKSPFFFLLFAAVVITFLLNEKIDSVLILVFIAINVILGFLQEYRSEQAVSLLRKFISHKEKVVRGGELQTIDATDLVPGDIIILDPGSIVPADIRLLESESLTLDEEVLTGESIHVQKYANYKDFGLLFSGTTVLSGQGTGVVFATGADTEFGNIAKLTTLAPKVSTFEKDLAKFSKYILRLVVGTLLVLMIINSLLKKGEQSLSELMLFSVALAVSVIPEALPVVTTFSLSQGSLKLARKKVVVKRLSSIEDLGGVEVLCTDKTGTLTQNNLEVKDMLTKDREKLLLFGNLASEALRTDSFDSALWSALKSKNDYSGFQQISFLPFDPFRKRTASLVKKDNKNYLISRGAPEEILKISKKISSLHHQEVVKWLKQKGLTGHRVLAVAYKPVKSTNAKQISRNEKNMQFLGLIAFSDPLKSTAFDAVTQANQLGVQIKILTGDSLEVASAVAMQVGIISDLSKAMLGQDFEKLDSLGQHKAVNEIHVFARVTPEQKYKIIQLLEEKYEVGFLGEGINDAPALKTANVSLVVESASDIARETADIILLQKDLKVIIDGIKEGRKVYANNKKYITATLSSNFGNFYAVGVASLLINYLPMLPLQILLVNLLSDFPMIAVATDTVDDADIASPKRYNLKTILIKATFLGVVSTLFDFIFFASFSTISASTLQTSWFIGSILTELVFLFSVRTNKLFLLAKFPSKILVILTAMAATLTVLIPFTSFGRSVFGFTTLTSTNLFMIASIVLGYFLTTEAAKLVFVRTYQRLSTTVAKH